MSAEIRINRPIPTGGPSMEPPGMQPMEPKSDSSKLPWVVLALVVVVLVVLGVVFRDKLFTSSMKNEKNKTVMTKSSGYQAVFLTNGQVYFGKIANVNDNYASLKDIYYLQVVQPPLQGTPQQQQQQQAQPQISLIKLGNELHGPIDEMQINRSQILFYEDLKDDSRVVQAIRDYKANPPK